MVLNIYVGRDKRLPDSIQVGFAIRRTRRLVGWELTRRGDRTGGWSSSSGPLLNSGLGLNHNGGAGEQENEYRRSLHNT
jgi:hypothetical protein